MDIGIPDIIQRLEADIDQSKSLRNKALLLCIGIDLYANLYAGKISNEMHAKRFKKYLERFANCSKTESEILYQCRSSLVHFYGAFNSSGKSLNVSSFEFESQEKLIEKKGQSKFIIGVDIFEKRYFSAKKNYLDYLENYDSAKTK